MLEVKRTKIKNENLEEIWLYKKLSAKYGLLNVCGQCLVKEKAPNGIWRNNKGEEIYWCIHKIKTELKSTEERIIMVPISQSAKAGRAGGAIKR